MPRLPLSFLRLGLALVALPLLAPAAESPADLGLVQISNLSLVPDFSRETSTYSVAAPFAPAAMRFDNVLSAEPAAGALQLKVNGSLRRTVYLGRTLVSSPYNLLGLRPSGETFVFGFGSALDPVPTAARSGVIGLAAHDQHALVLKNDGTVFAWGVPNSPHVAVPPAATEVVAVATSLNQSLALRRDGSVVSWGPEASLPSGAQTGVRRIATTGNSRLALRNDGGLVAWGSLPSPPAGAPADATDIAVGEGFALLLRSDGSVYAWGANGFGQATPPAATGSRIVAIAASFNHALALHADGRVIAWGSNGSGQTNVPADALSDVVAISAGWLHSAALKRDGRVVLWGNLSTKGPLTAERLAWPISAPLPLRPGANQVELRSFAAGGRAVPDAVFAAGGSRNLALHPDGRVLQWGVTATDTPAALPPATQSGIVAVAAGPGPVGEYLIRSDGSVYRLSGLAPHPDVEANTAGVSQPRVVDIKVGSPVVVALREDGSVRTWGASVFPDASNLIAVAAGTDYVLGLDTQGRVRAWGQFNSHGVLDVPLAARSGVVAIAARGSRVLALKADGSLVQWGLVNPAQAAIPPEAVDITAIALSSRSNFALKRDGSVIAWGFSASGIDTPPPEAASDVVALATGPFHQLALKRDGSVVAWGEKLSGGPAVSPPAGFDPLVSAPLRDYRFTVDRAVPSPALATLASSAGPLAPAFTAETRAYAQALPFESGAFTLTASPLETATASVRLRRNGAVSTAAIATPFTPRLGLNLLSLRVTAGGAPLADFPLAAGTQRNLARSSSGALMQAPVSGASFGSALPTGSDRDIAGVFSGGYGEYALRTDGSIGRISGANVPDEAQPTSPTHGFTRPPGVALAIGQNHALLLRADGSTYAWGASAITAIPAEAQTGVVAIASGSNHAVALRADGRVLAWGSNSSGESSVPPGCQADIVAIAAYGQRNLALRGDGLVIPWGAISYPADYAPQAALSGVVAIAVGERANLALKADGSVIAWGNDSAANIQPPAEAASGVVAIACGPRHQLALKEDGSVIAWGADGFSSSAPALSPVFPAALIEAPVRDYHVFVERRPPVAALSSLRLAAPGSGALSPAFSPLTDAYAAATATPYPGLALHTHAFRNGATYAVRASSSAPFATRLPGPTLATSGGGGYALRTNGQIVSWGSAFGAPAGSGFIAVAGGNTHGLALSPDGTVSAWGNLINTSNQEFASVRAVAITANANLAGILTPAGAPMVWGDIIPGNLRNIPADAADLVQLSAGSMNFVALRRDGRAVGWGIPAANSVPLDAQSGIVSVGAGYAYNLALRADGRVVAWGSLPGGQPVPPAATYGVVAIAAGAQHALAIKADGSVIAWGNGTQGETAVPATAATDVVAIAAGAQRSLALRADGTIVAWGGFGPSLVPAAAQGDFALPLHARLPLVPGPQTLELRVSPAEPAASPRTYVFTVEHAAAPSLALVAGTDTSPVNRQPDGIGQFAFGAQRVGVASPARVFTVLNSGSADLTLTAADFTGGSAGEFALSDLPLPQTLAAGAQTSFTLRSTPSATGNRGATLRLHANLPHGGPHHLPLLVTGITHASELATWRTAQFTSAERADPALATTVWGDLADPDGDGLPNLLEYALNSAPKAAGPAPAATLDASAEGAPRLTLAYTRVKRAALAGLVYRVEWSDSLAADSWSDTGVTEQITAATSSTETVAASVPADGPRRFLRLRVTAP